MDMLRQEISNDLATTQHDQSLYPIGMADDKLRKLVKERQELLSQNPHLRALQAEIDRIVQSEKDPNRRMMAIANMIRDMISHDLTPELVELVKQLHHIVDSSTKKKGA